MSPRHRWLLLWLALAAFVVVRAATRPDHRGVLLDHLEFGRRLLAGDDVYGPWRSDLDAPERPLHAPYPPSFGLLTAPFALVREALGLRAARTAWALLQVLLLAAMCGALRRLGPGPEPPDARRHRWLCLLAMAVLARFLLRDLHGGGGNLINVALCTLAFAAAERGRDGGRGQLAAGWLLGFSLATKPTQALLLPLLLALGHRRAAMHTAAATLAFALLSLGLLRFDIGPWLRWLHGSLALATQTDAFAPPAYDFPPFEWMNQSLRCACARWFGTVPADLAARVALGVPPGLGLSAAAAAAVARGLGLLLLGWLLLAAFRRRREPARRAFAFAAALVLSLLLSPLSWKAHHVALLPLLYLLLHAAWRRRSRALVAVLVAFALCCGVGQEVVGDAGDEWLNSLYVLPLFDLVLLAIALCCGGTATAARPADARPQPAAANVPAVRRPPGRPPGLR